VQVRQNEDEKIRTFLSVLEAQTRQPADPSYKWIDKLEDLLKEEYDAVIDAHLVKWLFEDIIKAKLDEEGLAGSSKDGKERKAVLTGQYLSVLKGKRDLYRDLRQKAMETEVGKVLKSYRASGLPAFSPDKYEKLRLLFEEKKIGFVERSIIDKIKNPGVYVVELRDLEDDEERREMVGRLLQQVFDESKRTDGGFQTLIVVEEAHNYAPEGKGGGALSARELRRIASEGRKFHVGLLVITQRPAYVSKDVLAQCNTSAVFRLVNNNDLKAIEASIEMVTQAQLDEIPAYEQGQCLITGVGVKEPVTVKIR
jgi:DNA helicase HerA-like ATPase